MVNSKHTTHSQAAIGRALGLSPASMTKLKHMGMPADSVEAARAWREEHIGLTAHRFAPTMHSSSKRSATPKPQPRPSSAFDHALALMMIADAALASGQSIAAMVPVLRFALAAVPGCERSDTLLLSVKVMDVLTADVATLIPPQGALNEDGSPARLDVDSMDDDEAAEMGRFWYQVAAGEIRPTAHRTRRQHAGRTA